MREHGCNLYQITRCNRSLLFKSPTSPTRQNRRFASSELFKGKLPKSQHRTLPFTFSRLLIRPMSNIYPKTPLRNTLSRFPFERNMFRGNLRRLDRSLAAMHRFVATARMVLNRCSIPNTTRRDSIRSIPSRPNVPGLPICVSKNN